MKTFNKQLLLGLTGACFVFGYSSLLATETSQQSLSTSKDENSSKKVDKDNVNRYLSDHQKDSYKFLEAKLKEAIKDTEFSNDERKVIKNLRLLGNNKVNNIKPTENSNEEKILMVSWMDLTKDYNKDL